MELDYKLSFEFVTNLVKNSSNIDNDIKIDNLKKLIDNLYEELKNDAPANFAQLYFDFQYEFDKLKDFILFRNLIGKNIISLGGAFSCGKSSFLNSIIGKKILPSKIEPTTSVPTYLIYGDNKVEAVNMFNEKIRLHMNDLKTISHGFSEEYNINFGHILKNISVETENQMYKNIAFLDTPGYSKADNKNYSARTDEKIARAQLNSSDYILWFINCENGTITEEDIKFINTLKKEIPKLIIINKSDKKSENDLENIKKQVKSTLDNKGILVEGVYNYSCRKSDKYDSEVIKKIIDNWNKTNNKQSFTTNFKRLFIDFNDYYEKNIMSNSKKLNILNRTLTLSDDDTIYESLSSLASEMKFNINTLKEKQSKLEELKNDFFSQLKVIGDVLRIDMPEPSEIDFIDKESINALNLVRYYKKKNNVKDTDYLSILKTTLSKSTKEINNILGGSCYSKLIAKEMDNLLKV